MASCVAGTASLPSAFARRRAFSAAGRHLTQAARPHVCRPHSSPRSRAVPAGPSTAAADRRQVLRRGVIVAAAEEVHTGAEGVRPYNGPVAASGRDSTAYGSERPGMNNEWNFMNSIPDSAVDEWVAHMKSNGISRVISLLSAKELTFYTTPLEELYHRAFGKSWRELNLRKEGALEKAMQYLDDAADNGEKVVIHCSGGQGRTALILASWLVHKYGLTPEEAVTEMVSYAKENNASRNNVLDKLPGFLEKGYLA
mmetsp:Transcript_23771/g.65944  ORF Transcript_23771/g.65944 Transcript_23771/m.65944 type:complete len:255 (+) Transcript_23771:203-967(+)|eukprot:CAMPEP_0117663324 /NCGR_PEP_ID=MMETSP0804-20121206/8540_1 /TAXON_ID=1074897 /ORGANISM="Tetraselmis astigmatica, Strain CCMP880" /LENGTH=254 /DNA_ID=CAMNT_0005470311 /DNA_START=159 /DNA_END=923 /DNA_ORIENTATION=-